MWYHLGPSRSASFSLAEAICESHIPVVDTFLAVSFFEPRFGDKRSLFVFCIPLHFVTRMHSYAKRVCAHRYRRRKRTNCVHNECDSSKSELLKIGTAYTSYVNHQVSIGEVGWICGSVICIVNWFKSGPPVNTRNGP